MTHNILNEPIHVKHSELERASEHSAYRSKCSVCGKGVLLVGRGSKTYELQPADVCILCGQHVIYDDIEEMRRKLG